MAAQDALRSSPAPNSLFALCLFLQVLLALNTFNSSVLNFLLAETFLTKGFPVDVESLDRHAAAQSRVQFRGIPVK